MNAAHQKQEHTNSYYAATANDPTLYPELEGSKQVDVCIVGAGFTGIATALTLAERGYSVAVIEAWSRSKRRIHSAERRPRNFSLKLRVAATPRRPSFAVCSIAPKLPALEPPVST